MSNIEKSDVKNQLSPRFSTEIHLCQPVSRPDATGMPDEESDDRRDKVSIQNPLKSSSTGGRKLFAVANPESVKK